MAIRRSSSKTDFWLESTQMDLKRKQNEIAQMKLVQNRRADLEQMLCYQLTAAIQRVDMSLNNTRNHFTTQTLSERCVAVDALRSEILGRIRHQINQLRQARRADQIYDTAPGYLGQIKNLLFTLKCGDATCLLATAIVSAHLDTHVRERGVGQGGVTGDGRICCYSLDSRTSDGKQSVVAEELDTLVASTSAGGADDMALPECVQERSDRVRLASSLFWIPPATADSLLSERNMSQLVRYVCGNALVADTPEDAQWCLEQLTNNAKTKDVDTPWIYVLLREESSGVRYKTHVSNHTTVMEEVHLAPRFRAVLPQMPVICAPVDVMRMNELCDEAQKMCELDSDMAKLAQECVQLQAHIRIYQKTQQVLRDVDEIVSCGLTQTTTSEYARCLLAAAQNLVYDSKVSSNADTTARYNVDKRNHVASRQMELIARLGTAPTTTTIATTTVASSPSPMAAGVAAAATTHSMSYFDVLSENAANSTLRSQAPPRVRIPSLDVSSPRSTYQSSLSPFSATKGKRSPMDPPAPATRSTSLSPNSFRMLSPMARSPASPRRSIPLNTFSSAMDSD